MTEHGRNFDHASLKVLSQIFEMVADVAIAGRSYAAMLKSGLAHCLELVLSDPMGDLNTIQRSRCG